MSKDTWLVVLGAALAMATSVVIEVVKIRLGDARRKRAFKIILRGEIAAIVEIIGRITDEFPRVDYIPVNHLYALDTARLGYDRNRDHAVLFTTDFQRCLLDFYRVLLIARQEAAAIEAMPTTSPVPDADLQQYQAWRQNQRHAALDRLRDAAVAGRSLLNQIDAA